MDTITIRLSNNTQQLADIETVKMSAHSMAGAALDFARNGSQGYDQFLASKEQFEVNVDNFFKNYKYCEITHK
jgi:hypothetical protein